MVILKIKKNSKQVAEYLITSEEITQEELEKVTETIKHLIEKSFIDTLKPWENKYELIKLFPPHLKIKITDLSNLNEVILNV